MKTSLADFHQTILLNQNRRKIWRWSEVVNQTGLLPTQFKYELENQTYQTPDPFWFYTQSAKNYTPWASQAILENYQNPVTFSLHTDVLGISTKLLIKSSKPLWANTFYNTDWYWQQKQILRLFPYLRLIPGVRSIFLLSSSQMEIANSGSDIDLAFLCYPNTAWLSRFYAKTIFKLTGHDVHPFNLEVYRYFLEICMGLQLPNWLNKRLTNQNQNIRQQIWTYKNRPGLKLDAGIFFQNELQLTQIYGQEPRQQAWLWNKLELSQNLPEVNNLAKNNSILYLPTSLNTSIKLIIWGLIIYCSLPIGVILAILQYAWIVQKNASQTNFWISLGGIGFIPRFYKDGYLKALLDKK